MKHFEDPVLQRLKQSFIELFGERLDKVVLFGSRARGDEREDLDYDIAVFLRNMGQFSRESESIAKIETEILFEAGAVINSIPFPVGADRERSGFMNEIRREDLVL